MQIAGPHTPEFLVTEVEEGFYCRATDPTLRTADSWNSKEER